MVEGLRERHNKSEKGFTEEMTFELGLGLGFHRSRGEWGGGKKGVRACPAKESAYVVLKSTWAHTVSGDWPIVWRSWNIGCATLGQGEEVNVARMPGVFCVSLWRLGASYREWEPVVGFKYRVIGLYLYFGSSCGLQDSECTKEGETDSWKTSWENHQLRQMLKMVKEDEDWEVVHCIWQLKVFGAT